MTCASSSDTRSSASSSFAHAIKLCSEANLCGAKLVHPRLRQRSACHLTSTRKHKHTPTCPSSFSASACCCSRLTQLLITSKSKTVDLQLAGPLAASADLARMPRVQAQRAARRVSRVRHARGPDRKREGRGSGGGRRGEAAGE